MSQEANKHFCSEIEAELEMLELGAEAYGIAIENLGGLWGRAINHGGVDAELTKRLKRMVGNLKSSQRTNAATIDGIRKISTGEIE